MIRIALPVRGQMTEQEGDVELEIEPLFHTLMRLKDRVVDDLTVHGLGVEIVRDLFTVEETDRRTVVSEVARKLVGKRIGRNSDIGINRRTFPIKLDRGISIPI